MCVCSSSYEHIDVHDHHQSTKAQVNPTAFNKVTLADWQKTSRASHTSIQGPDANNTASSVHTIIEIHMHGMGIFVKQHTWTGLHGNTDQLLVNGASEVRYDAVMSDSLALLFSHRCDALTSAMPRNDLWTHESSHQPKQNTQRHVSSQELAVILLWWGLFWPIPVSLTCSQSLPVSPPRPQSSIVWFYMQLTRFIV